MKEPEAAGVEERGEPGGTERRGEMATPHASGPALNGTHCH